jgi:hypothetical protein
MPENSHRKGEEGPKVITAENVADDNTRIRSREGPAFWKQAKHFWTYYAKMGIFPSVSQHVHNILHGGRGGGARDDASSVWRMPWVLDLSGGLSSHHLLPLDLYAREGE